MIDITHLKNKVGEAQLIQLSDLDGTGSLDAGKIDDVIEEAKAYVGSFITLPADPTYMLLDILADHAIYCLRERNGLLSERDDSLRESNRRTLEKMRKGLLPISQNTPDQSPKQETPIFTRHRVPEGRIIP